MSTETKWTPGPWRRKGYAVTTEKGEHLFEVFPPADPTLAEEAQAKADAQLAAAAPKMYEALRALTDNGLTCAVTPTSVAPAWRKPGVPPCDCWACEWARLALAAIAAADGREAP